MGADGTAPGAAANAGGPGGTSTGSDLRAVDAAVAALQAQRAVLGDDVVETALAPLRERRALLEARSSGEQRKLVTVLFADLVDSTGLTQHLDPEDVRRLVNDVFVRWRAAIEAEGGTVEKFVGDAVMAVFGLVRSFEDDAERAVRAAFALREAVRDVSGSAALPVGTPELHLRVGVDTGDVVVGAFGERGADDLVAVGATVNRAARLQAAAPVDGVLVSESTRRQARGRFAVVEHPGMVLKGLDAPVDAYEVLALRPRDFLLDRGGGVEGVEVPTVGRHAELELLQDAVRDVTAAERFRVVTVVGDAGIGKSRLLRDLDTWLAERPENVWWFRGRAWASTSRQPGALLRDALATRFHVQATDSPDVAAERVAAGLGTVLEAHEVPSAARLVSAWLGLGGPSGTPVGTDAPDDPQSLHDEGSRQLAGYVARLAERAPVVVLLEDLHWADDASLRWLDAAAPVLAASPVLVVATARPSFLDDHPTWGAGVHHQRLTLGPLTPDATQLLVRTLIAAADDVPDRLLDLVTGTADGNPYYVEELVARLVDEGVVDRSATPWRVHTDLLGAIALPDTLRGLLQARIDSLPADDRATLQRAAVVGRVFWDAAVVALTEDDGAAGPPARATVRSIDALVDRGLVLARDTSGVDGTRELLFRHALLRDAAYEAVLRDHRRRLHLLAARWLESVAERSGRTDAYAAQVADHHDRARSPDAPTWYVRAGRHAATVYANAEALALLDRAVELLPGRTDVLRFDAVLARESVLERVGDREREAADVAELAELTAPTAQQGHGVGVRVAADPARRVAGMLARTRWEFLHSRYDETTTLADRVAEDAAAAGLSAQEAEAHLWAGRAMTWAGATDAARERLDRALELARSCGRTRTAAEALRYLAIVAANTGRYPQSLALAAQSRTAFEEAGDSEGAVMAMSVQANTYFALGKPRDARGILREVLDVFERTGHRYRQAVVRSNLAVTACGLGEYAEAEQLARSAWETLQDVDDVETAAAARITMASVDLQVGRWDDAEAGLVAAVAACSDLGAGIVASDACFRLSWLARRRGDLRAASRYAEDALAVDEGTLEHANALLAVGLAARASGDRSAAADALALASAELTALDVPVRGHECAAAQATLLEGSDAVAAVEPLLAVLDVDGLEGAEEPELVLEACVDVLTAAGDPRLTFVRHAVASYLRDRAATVGDDDLAARYLADPTRAALLASCEA